MNWFTTVLVDGEKRLQIHWVKSGNYRPVSRFSYKVSLCKFVNFMISGGIGPIQKSNTKHLLDGKGLHPCGNIGNYLESKNNILSPVRVRIRAKVRVRDD